MSSPKKKHKPGGLQFDFDQEVADQARIYSNSPEVTINRECPEPAGVGYPDNNIYKDKERMGTPPPSPTPPSPPNPKPCLYDEPATREAIRRKLKDLGVINISQLIRNYECAVLLEAINDFERALAAGIRLKSPTAYFGYLLR